MDATTSTADHDLLIEVNTNVKNLTSTLEAYTMASNRQIQDHEHRIRQLESENQQLKGAQRSQKNNQAIMGTAFAAASVGLAIWQALGS